MSHDVALPVITAWCPMPPEIQEQGWVCDESKDTLFATYVNDVLRTVAPWLPPLIRAAHANVVAGPGRFFIVTPGDQFHLVPELSVYMNLLPWAEPGETCH